MRQTSLDVDVPDFAVQQNPNTSVAIPDTRFADLPDPLGDGSLIGARTSLGARILEEAHAAGRLKTEVFDISNLEKIQPGQRERRRALFARLAELRLLGRPIPRYAGLQIRSAALQNPLGRNLKNFLGTLRRALRRL